MLRFFALIFLLIGPGFAAAQETRLAKIMLIAPTNGDVTRQFFGHVAAKETVDLAFQVGGQVLELPLVEGEPIAKGTLVAQLDLEPFQLSLDQARVQLEQSQRTLERLQKLQGSTVSQVTVDDADTAVKLAEIAVRNAERSLTNATLVAPFDALVASRNVANFSTIAAGTPIARLHDMSDLRIEIDVPEILFQRAGSDPDIRLWAQFPTSDTEYPVEPREFNAETSQVGQTFQITLGMAPPEEIVVLPGSSVTVFAQLKTGASAIRIPASAIMTSNNGDAQVMVFEPAGAEAGTVRPQPVTVTPGPNGEVIVTSGLEPGLEIIVSGASQLSEGDQVTRFTGFTN